MLKRRNAKGRSGKKTRVVDNERYKEDSVAGNLAFSRTDIEIEVFPKMVCISINILKPSVKELMKVIKVILAETTRRVAGCCGFTKCQAFAPTVILSNAEDDITVVAVQGILKEFGSCTDIEVRILAIATRSPVTFLSCDLHQTLFPATANGARVTRAFLECEGSDHDGRKMEFCTILLKEMEVLGASLERTSVTGHCIG